MIETVKGVFVPDKLRFWSLTTYATEYYVRNVLELKEDMLAYAEYIYHDDEGVEPHIHINLITHKPIDSPSLVSWFKTCLDGKGEMVNTFALPTKFADDAHDYLRHVREDGGRDNG